MDVVRSAPTRAVALGFALLQCVAPSIEAGRSVHDRSLTQSTGFQIPPPPATIATAASGIPDLSIFAQAVAASPLISSLAKAPSTAVTVFAPTNEASDTAPCAQTNS